MEGPREMSLLAEAIENILPWQNGQLLPIHGCSYPQILSVLKPVPPMPSVQVWACGLKILPSTHSLVMLLRGPWLRFAEGMPIPERAQATVHKILRTDTYIPSSS